MAQQATAPYADDPFMAEALTYVYIAQYARQDGPERAGVLVDDCQRYSSQIKRLLSAEDIQDASSYKLSGFVTTAEGTRKAQTIIDNRLATHTAQLEAELGKIPGRILQYFQDIILADELHLGNVGRQVQIDNDIGNYDRIFPLSNDRPSYWCLLSNKDIRDTRDRLFQLLTTLKLVIKAHSYALTRGGEQRNFLYVPAPELQSFFRSYLARVGLVGYLWPEELEDMHTVFHILNSPSNDSLPTKEELNRKIPVRYWESVNEFIKECLTQKVLAESTHDPAYPYLIVKDVLWYNTERTRRYKKPLLDFLLGQYPLPYIEATKQPVDFAIVEVPQKRGEVSQKDEGPSSARNMTEETKSTQLAILLGVNGSENIFWVPASEHNWNFAIVGAAGTGKTQTVMAVLKELARKQVPYLVFDFKGDYVPVEAPTSKFGSVLDLGQISINPLELDGTNSPRDQKYQLADIVNLVYNVGDLQVKYVQDAIKMSYAHRGINEDDKTTWTKPVPTFADLQQNLQRQAAEGTAPVRNSINGIFARLDPIFDYRVFSARTAVPFERLISGQTVVDLGHLKNDNLKAVVVEFLLRKLRYYLYTLPDSRLPRMFVVIDEAHRLKYEREASAGQLLKEARSKGIGLLLATQDPVDFTDVVYNNIGGILALCLPDPTYAKKVAAHLGGKVTWQDVKNNLSSKFSAFVKFSSRPNAIAFKIIPFYERQA